MFDPSFNNHRQKFFPSSSPMALPIPAELHSRLFTPRSAPTDNIRFHISRDGRKGISRRAAYWSMVACFLILSTLMSVTAMAQSNSSGFALPMCYDTVSNALCYQENGTAGTFSVTTGDFNSDGKPDIVTANFYRNNVSLLLNQGGGTFQSATTFAVGATPIAVTTGDFNNDGKLDFATANYNANSISIRLGNGNGTFQSAVNSAVGTNPQFVMAGDFNNDGLLDIATANYGSNNASILLGNGDGTFQSRVNYPVGTNPVSITIGDFNGDGKLDFATANQISNNVSVLLGNGDGTFQSKVDYTVGTNPVSVTTGDFNNDGKLDLVAANNGTNYVSILLNNGDGTFQNAVNYTVGNNPVSVTTGDFNNDGELDVATADYTLNNTGDVHILPGNGDGTFLAALEYNTDAQHTIGAVNAITTNDLNGDGKLDLVTADRDRSVNVLLNIAAPRIVFFDVPDNFSGYVSIMKKDGSDRRHITANFGLVGNVFPSLSSDGQKIVFSWNGGDGTRIYTINSNGTNQTQITSSADGSFQDILPAWSPDGTKIVFVRRQITDHRDKIYVMNADGTNQTQLTNGLGNDPYPAWSPDGTKIVFSSSRHNGGEGGGRNLYVMNADGSNVTRLTEDNLNNFDEQASWSPDGSKIVFRRAYYNRLRVSDIIVINANGSNPQTLSINNGTTDNQDPSWSPDGDRIVIFAQFYDDEGHASGSSLFLINPDGSNPQNIGDGALASFQVPHSTAAPTPTPTPTPTPAPTNISITLNDSPDPVTIGNNLTYTINVTNNGASTVTDLLIADRIPSSTSFVSVTSSGGFCNQEEGNVECSFSSLASGATVTETIVVNPTVAGTITNTAKARLINERPPSNPNATATETTTVLAAPMSSYTISGQVTDSNNNALNGVTMTLSGSQSGTTTTNAGGQYSFSVTAGGNYTVTPSQSGYIFSPSSQTFNNLSGNQTANFNVTASNVTNQMSVTRSGLIYSRTTRTFNGTVTITNTGNQPVSAPLQLVFANLTSGVDVVNKTGTFQGSPYITASVSSLAPGASVNVAVRFSNPSNAMIDYTPQVYSGSF